MIQVDERVIVLDNKKVLGFAFVKDICKTKNELSQYFQNNHPKLSVYEFAIHNNECVYIVDFDNDNGQGGYLKGNLRKLKMK